MKYERKMSRVLCLLLVLAFLLNFAGCTQPPVSTTTPTTQATVPSTAPTTVPTEPEATEPSVPAPTEPAVDPNELRYTLTQEDVDEFYRLLAECEALAIAGEDMVHFDDKMGGGSTDMGDLSTVIPSMHPHVTGAEGNLNNGDSIWCISTQLPIEGYTETTYADGTYYYIQWVDGYIYMEIFDGVTFEGYAYRATLYYYPIGSYPNRNCVKSSYLYFFADGGHVYTEFDEDGNETVIEDTTNCN